MKQIKALLQQHSRNNSERQSGRGASPVESPTPSRTQPQQAPVTPLPAPEPSPQRCLPKPAGGYVPGLPQAVPPEIASAGCARWLAFCLARN